MVTFDCISLKVRFDGSVEDLLQRVKTLILHSNKYSVTFLQFLFHLCYVMLNPVQNCSHRFCKQLAGLLDHLQHSVMAYFNVNKMT